MGMDDAYAVQNAIYRAKLAEGRRVSWLEDWADVQGDAVRAEHRHSLTVASLFDDMAFDHGVDGAGWVGLSSHGSRPRLRLSSRRRWAGPMSRATT